MTSERSNAACWSGPPLTEREAEAQGHGIAFKTGPPGQVGVELEWLVCDGRDPALPVDQGEWPQPSPAWMSPERSLAGAG